MSKFRDAIDSVRKSSEKNDEEQTGSSGKSKFRDAVDKARANASAAKESASGTENAIQAPADYQQKYAGKTYDEISSVISDMEKVEEARRQEYFKQNEQGKKWSETLIGYHGGVNDTSMPVAAALQAGHGSQKDTGYVSDNNELKWLKENRYGFVRNQDDFETGSAIGQPETVGGRSDELYLYLNGTDEKRSEIDLQYAIGIGQSPMQKNNYNQIKDDEVGIYNYLYSKYGKKEADKYLYSIGSTLAERANAETTKKYSEFADKHPVLGSIGSVGTSLASGFEYVDDALSYLRDAAYYGDEAQMGTNSMAVATNAARGTVMEKVDWEIGNWDAFDFLYGTTMSGVDSFASMAFGNYGGAVLGLSAAAQGTNDALQRGMSSRQAFWNGLFSGVFEALFESVSIGNFKSLKEVPPDTFKIAAKNIAKSMLVNVSEETATEIANIAYDTMANGELANYTLDDFQNGAMKDVLLQVLEAGAGGALMGFGMGGIGNIAGYLNGKSKNTLGEAMPETGQAQTENGDLLSAALEKIRQDGFASNGMEEDILGSQDAMDILSGQAGLENLDGMTKSQKRRAVKDALERLSQAAQTENRDASIVDTGRIEMDAERVQERPAEQRANDIRNMQDAASALGVNGAKALMTVYDGSSDAGSFFGDFAAYYNAGLSGKDMEKVQSRYGANLTEAQRYAAYSAGKNDASASLESQRLAAQYATVAGEDSGLVLDDYVEQAIVSGRKGEKGSTYLSGKDYQTLNAVCKALGVRARFVDSVLGGKANAQIKGNEILIAKDHRNPLRFVFGHELTHRMQELAPDEYRAFREYVSNRETAAAEIESRMELYAKNGVELSFEDALDEMAADYAGELIEGGKVLDDFIEQHRDNRTLLQKVRDAIRSIIAKLTGAERRQAKTAEGKLTAALEAAAKQASKLDGNKNTTPEGGVRYSINEQFSKELREWYEDGRSAGELFVLGSTGSVLQGLGAIESDIYMNGDKISAILEQHPEMSIREIQRIPDILDNPTLILKSKGKRKRGNNSRMVLYGSIKAQDGQPVLALLDLRPRENGFMLDDMQKVNSAYTKENPVGFLTSSDVLYADKKRTIPLLRQFGLTISSRQLLRNGSVGSISYNGDNVKMNGVPFSSVVDLTGVERFSFKEDSEDLVSVLKKNHTDATMDSERYSLKDLTDSEWAAALAYKSSESYKINTKLRDGLPLTEAEQKMVADLDSALEKLPTVKGTVYRTLNFDDVFNPEETFNAFMALHTDGAFAYYNAYTSASTKTDGYPIANGTKYGVTIEISSSNARDLSGIGNNFESEVLFAHGTDFIVRSVRIDDNGYTHIVMEEVHTDEERNKPEYDTEKRSVAVRDLQEAYPVHGDLQSAPAGYPGGNQVRESDLQGTREEGNDGEVKFSLKGEYDATKVAREQEELRQENERLRGRVERLNAQFKTTKPGTETVRQGDVDKLAKRLIKNYESTLETGDLSGSLKELGEFLIRGGDGKNELTWAAVHEKALGIAGKIVENAVTVNDELYQQYSDLRSYLRTTKLTISEADSHNIADFGDFRKSQFGRFRLARGDTNIDSVYHEMCGLWPEFFDEELHSHPADQLLHIVDVLDGLQPVYENPYSYDMETAKEYVAGEILDSLMGEDVRQEPPTFADRQAQRLAETKAKGQQQVQKVRQQANERLAMKIEQNRQRAKKALAKEREKRIRQVDALKKHYADIRKAKAARAADSKARTRLLNIARRLQNKKLPAVNRALLDQYIGELDTYSKGITGKTLEKLSELKEWYNDRKENDPDFISDPKVERMLSRLTKRHISEMSAEEVADLTTVLLNIENEIRTEHKLIDEADRRDTYHMGQEVIQNIYNTKGSSGVLDKFIVTETLSPMRQVRRMTGYVDSDPMYKLTQSLADGQRAMIDYQMRAERPFEKYANDKAFSKNFSGPKAEAIEIEGLVPGGTKKVTITPAMRVALYLHSKNDQNLRHIKEGGITVPDEKLYREGKLTEAYARGTTVKLTPSQVRAITAKMTDTERMFALAAQRYFNETSQQAINQTSEKLKGYSLAQVDNYFPINTDTSFTRSEFEMLKRDGTIEGMGFLKERVNAANPILLRDVNAVLEQAIGMHAKYVGLAIPVRNFNKVWSVTTGSFNEDGSRNNFEASVQQAVKQRWGETGYNYIEKMMTDLQGGASSKNAWAKALNKVRSKYAGAVLTLNLSVAMKQAASYPTAAAVLGWKPLARAMTDFGKVDLERIEKYTPLQWYRSKGFSTKELGDLKTAGRQLPAVLNWVQGADLLTTRKLWKASEYYVRMNNNEVEIGTESYWRAVADIYNRVIEETQPNYTTMQRPQLLRSDDTLMGNLAMFKTQPFQNFNIVYEAAGNYLAKAQRAKTGDAQTKAEAKKAKVALGHAITSQIAQLAVFAGMTMAWAMLRGRTGKYEDDDDEMTLPSVLAAIGKDMVGGVFSTVPFGSDAWELLSSKLFGDSYYGMDAVTVTAISDAIQSLSDMAEQIGRIAENMATGDSTDWGKEWQKLDRELDNISKFIGVPYENVANLFNIVYQAIVNAVK